MLGRRTWTSGQAPLSCWSMMVFQGGTWGEDLQEQDERSEPNGGGGAHHPRDIDHSSTSTRFDVSEVPKLFKCSSLCNYWADLRPNQCMDQVSVDYLWWTAINVLLRMTNPTYMFFDSPWLPYFAIVCYFLLSILIISIKKYKKGGK